MPNTKQQAAEELDKQSDQPSEDIKPQLILFSPERNRPLLAYKVGCLGVESIEAVRVDITEGMETYKYVVYFANGDMKGIENTFHVEYS